MHTYFTFLYGCVIDLFVCVILFCCFDLLLLWFTAAAAVLCFYFCCYYYCFFWFCFLLLILFYYYYYFIMLLIFCCCCWIYDANSMQLHKMYDKYIYCVWDFRIENEDLDIDGIVEYCNQVGLRVGMFMQTFWTIDWDTRAPDTPFVAQHFILIIFAIVSFELNPPDHWSPDTLEFHTNRDDTIYI